VFGCASGIEFLEQLTEDKLKLIYPWIEPDYWQKRFEDFIADAEWTKEVLKKAGL
jgi:hypothetical protein